MRIKGIFLVVAALVISGCGGGAFHRAEIEQGSVLVLPARDVVQSGALHEMGKGTGELMTVAIVRELQGSKFIPLTSKEEAFSHTEVASLDSALAEARKLGASYCLQVVLGEFRNAAPMTFRSDFVTLEKATMFNVATGEEVWRLKKPIMLEKTNLGNHLGLIDDLAKKIAVSITRG